MRNQRGTEGSTVPQIWCNSDKYFRSYGILKKMAHAICQVATHCQESMSPFTNNFSQSSLVSSVTCRRSVVSSGYSGFLHQKTDFIIMIIIIHHHHFTASDTRWSPTLWFTTRNPSRPYGMWPGRNMPLYTVCSLGCGPVWLNKEYTGATVVYPRS